MIPVTVEQLSQIVYPVSIYVEQTVEETITGDGNWQSPGTNIVLTDPAPKNCSYTGGSINYDGTITVTRDLYANITVRALANNTNVILSAGANDTPVTSPNPSVEITQLGDEALLTIKIPVEVQGNNGDTVDFFIKADKDFTLVGGYFTFGEEREEQA